MMIDSGVTLINRQVPPDSRVSSRHSSVASRPASPSKAVFLQQPPTALACAFSANDGVDFNLARAAATARRLHPTLRFSLVVSAVRSAWPPEAALRFG